MVLIAACTLSISAKSPPLILKHADFNENTIVDGKLISLLEGSVEFEYDKAVIMSQRATWFRRDGIVQFSGDVRVNQERQFLLCDYLDFDRSKKIATVRGNVDFFDEKENSRITADHGTYHLDTRFLVLDRKPRFYRYDTAAVDTMTVIGKRMTYNDSTKIATVIDSVRILKGELTAYSTIAHYHLQTDIARLRSAPLIYYDVHDLKGDSVDLQFTDKRLHTVTVMGRAKGVHRDYGTRDTIITTVTGDSLCMLIRPTGTIDTLWVYGNARSSYYLFSDTASVNEAVGKIMVLGFTDKGQARSLRISGNAVSTYYVEDEGGKGRNEASGDRILVMFDNGKASYIRLTGSVRGIYFAQAGK